MAPVPPGSLVLRQGLEKLPQELYDMIYDLAFTAAPGIRELGTIVKGLKNITRPSDATSHLLHVDRRSRIKYAASYYGDRAVFIAYDAPTLTAWLALVPEAHRTLVTDIRCIVWRNTLNDPTSDKAWPKETEIIKSVLDNANLDKHLASRIRLGTSDYATGDLDGYADLARVAASSR